MFEAILAMPSVEDDSALDDDIEPEGRDDIVARKTRELIEMMPELVYDRDSKRGAEAPGPLQIFLSQELVCIGKVLRQVNDALTGLLLALAGNSVMSDELERIAISIHDGTVPAVWSGYELNPGNSALGTWFKVLHARAEQLREWIGGGRIPSVVLITLCFNPVGLITSAMQKAARSHGWPLDQVQLRSEVCKETDPPALQGESAGVLLGGLVLEGAEYENQAQCLRESTSRATHCPMPPVHVSGILSGGGMSHDTRAFSCPVYQFAQRGARYHIMSVELRSEDAVPDRWVLRGVAMIGESS